MTNESSEEILGIFPGYKKSNTKMVLGTFPEWKKSDKETKCKVYVTTSRIIWTEEKQEKTSILFREKKSLLPEYIYSTVSPRERLQMKQISPDSILKLSPENFEIPYPKIAVAELKEAMGGECMDLHIFTAENLDTPKYDIGIRVSYMLVEIVQDLFYEVLPDKIS